MGFLNTSIARGLILVYISHLLPLVYMTRALPDLCQYSQVEITNEINELVFIDSLKLVIIIA